MTEINPINVEKINNVELKKAGTTEAKTTAQSLPQMSEIPSASLGRDLVTKPTVLKAGEVYNGKTFDVQALGSNPITVEEVTADNVGKYSKCIDIWYQEGEEAALAKVKNGEPDPRFLHPEVGGSIQHYGLEPINGEYVTHDPKTLEYARNNGLTAFNEKGEECFINRYNGNKSVIESTYTTADGKFLKEVGGLKGKMEATLVKDMKVALMPVGTKVVPLEKGNPKVVGVGDVVCCASKKGIAQNDWYVKPVTEFLETAKANAEKGNTDLISALEKFVETGTRDAGEWAKILKRFAK